MTKVSQTRSESGPTVALSLHTCISQMTATAKKLTNVSYVAKLSSSSFKVPRGAPQLARLAASVTWVRYDGVSTRLTLNCWPVFCFFQNGFGGESLGRSPLVGVNAGLHHSRRLRGGQVSQCVSTRCSLDP